MADLELTFMQSGNLVVEDVSEYRVELNALWDLELTQIEAPKSKFRCRYLTDGRSVIYEELFGASTMAVAALRGRRMCFALTNPTGRTGCWKGKSLPDFALAYTHGGREVDAMLPMGTVNLMVMLPMEAFSQRLEELTGWTLEKAFPPAGIHLPLTRAAYLVLESRLRKVLNSRAHGSTTGLQHELTEAIVAACINQFEGAQDGSPASWYLFRRAIARMEPRERPPHFAELAADLGVTLRSVETAFHRCAGLSPGAYFRRVRLNRVRQELLLHRPEAARVTDLALKHGFTELGRFSVEYARLFGERPPTRCITGP